MAVPNVTREQELWALALHIEHKHGADGPRYIAERIGKFAMKGDQGGVDLWKEVARRYEQMISRQISTQNAL